mmetsp:Transcript_21928/g.45049  ORF Transcript_21928/g.45049 Transcript_21928/m.45049 type:complete len:225 (+) Transcript_21928:207-881(+)
MVNVKMASSKSARMTASILRGRIGTRSSVARASAVPDLSTYRRSLSSPASYSKTEDIVKPNAAAVSSVTNSPPTPESAYQYTSAYNPSAPEPDYPALGPTSKLNLFSAINSAMSTAMSTDPTAIVFGEDVAFGGVFRCSQNLLEEFGSHRVFNTPLSENGIAGMAVGYASAGGTAIGEIQFADYIFPAMDQIVNEMAKFRYRSGNQWNCGGVTLRAPCGAVSFA